MLTTACTDTSNDTPEHIGTVPSSTTIRAVHAPQTRTGFDGTATTWIEGDAMSVIIVDETGKEQAYKFSVTDPANGIFKCDGLELAPSATYDFHAVYPYSADKITNGETDNALFDIGSATQTQEGRSAAHIASLDPLTGSIEAVTPDKASLTMQHTATVLQLNLYNDTANTIAGIESVKITAPDGTILAALHTIDLIEGTTTPDIATASNTIELTVAGSGEIPADEQFTCWVAATPFTMNAGTALNIEVTAADGKTYSIDKTFNADRTFPAATIMTTDIVLAPQEITLDIDFTLASSYPEGFPTYDYPNITTNEYTFAGYTFIFEHTGRYYFLEGSKPEYCYFAIENIMSNKSADIILPQIEGYTPIRAEISVHSSCKNRIFQISVTGEDGKAAHDEPPMQTGSIFLIGYDLHMTEDHSAHRIHAISNNPTATTLPLTGLSVTYSRI